MNTIAIFAAENEILWANSSGEIRRATGSGGSEIVVDADQRWRSAILSPSRKTVLAWTGREVQSVDLAQKVTTTLATVPGVHSERMVPFVFGATDEQCFHLKAEDEIVQARSGDSLPLAGGFSKFIPSPDRSLFAITGRKNISVHRFTDGKRVGLLNLGSSPAAVGISADNKRVLIGEYGNGGGLYDRKAYLCEIASGELLSEFVADQFQILGVAFGPDSSRFVTKSNSVSVWEYANGKVSLLRRHEIENHSNKLHVFRDGRIIVFQSNDVVLLDPIGSVINRFDFSERFGEVIAFDETRNEMVCGRSFQELEVWDFVAGKRVRQIQKDFVTPTTVPSRQLRANHQFVAGAQFWDTDYGNFLHQGDGPRGWVTPLKTSDCGDFVVVPTESRGLVIQLSQQRVAGECPFEGRLRASRCSDEFVAMVNSAGQIYRSQLR